MKRMLSFICCGPAHWRSGGPGQSPQPKPYKVVFDLTSSDPLDQQAVLRWIKKSLA